MAYLVWLFIILYGGSLVVIFFFAVMQSHLLLLYLRLRKNKCTTPPVLQTHPLVTIQLPVYNERYVVERLLAAVDNIIYPKERLQIQVLDDSTDETTALISDAVAKMSGAAHVEHIRRTQRIGYKAGALKVGLQRATGEFIAMLDADFIPPADFLLRLLPFFQDKKVGFVQAPWGYLNANYSLLTRLQAIGLTAHFLIEQCSRQMGGYFIHFNGTAGIWRKRCIFDAGNWSGDTLTEDIDLSYRAQMMGWTYRYVEGFHIPSELPLSMQAIKAQYRRWNKGNMQNLIKHFSSLCRTPMRTAKKLHAIHFVFSSSTFFLIFLNTLLSVPLLWLKNQGFFSSLFTLASMFFVGLLPFVVLHVMACRQDHNITKKWQHFLLYFPGFLALSMSLSLSNSMGILEALFKPKTPFVRTPKWGISGTRSIHNTKENRYIRTKKLSAGTWAELFLFLYVLFGFCYGIYLVEYGFLLFHGLLCIGYACIVWHTLFTDKKRA